MFQPTKLELILEGLLRADQENIPTEQRTMKFLNDLMQIRMDAREMELLEAELLLNGYIAKENGVLFITSSGKRSLAVENKTPQLNTLQIQERMLRYQAIEQTQSTDTVLWIGLSVLVLTLVGFVIAVTA
jgi:hypothetical protein